MPTIADLLERNKTVNHTPFLSIAERKERQGAPPRTVVVTCCDPRCVPEQFFNLKAGEVVVHRNSGGNIRYALRDILTLDSLYRLDEIAIVQHTDCGTLRFTDEQIRRSLKERVAEKHWADIDRMDFGANTDIVESITRDLKWVREHPLIRDGLKQGTQGFVYDLKSGKVERVNA